jgi:hypothetical protein
VDSSLDENDTELGVFALPWTLKCLWTAALLISCQTDLRDSSAMSAPAL